ncbi:uncharacterized protein LOC117339900 [Pecten maximus]|uniref:uncharacterized protein LOC117339900 n=1 Tax=Pecten maximus TaxID=6579 RepID=UPI0014585BBA|nr:uncharacterized protein LOC117339900 [Pecten maximus]
MKQGFTASYFTLAIIKLACIYPVMMEAAPISGYKGSWRNPCNEATPSFEPYNTTNENKAHVLQVVLIQLEEAKIVADNLKHEYRTHRVANQVSDGPCVSGFEDNLDNVYRHVDGFPDLSQYFVQRNTIAICDNISATFLDDYRTLVQVMIFLEETIEEEYTQNNRIYEHQLLELHGSIKGIMCNFHFVEQRCGLEEQHLNATEMIDQYKASPVSERDYLLIRDIAVLVRALHARYNTCNILLSRGST